MNNNVLVIYSWKAKEGQLNQLISIYKEVLNQMEANEPGALEVELFVNEADNSITVRDLFNDAGAVAFHLQETASKHFNDLMQIAEPGLFQFSGPVPDEIKSAIQGMGLQAQFNSWLQGFKR